MQNIITTINERVNPIDRPTTSATVLFSKISLYTLIDNPSTYD